MSTPDTNNIGIKLQAAGENLNTWGDPNLNNDFIITSHLSSGWNPITINGNYDVASNETNFSTTNPSEYAIIKLVTGTVAAAFTFTLANRAKRMLVWNATSFACQMKLSVTTGFSLPAGYFAWIGTDGAADVYNLSPNLIAGPLTVAGQIHGVTNPTATTDGANKTYVDTAIATAGLPATSGTILNSGGDTTAGYHAAKHSLTISGALTGAYSTTNPGANENLLLTLSVGALGLTQQAEQTAGFTAVAGNIYPVNIAVSGTVLFPAAASAGDTVGITNYGAGTVTFNWNGLKYNASTNTQATNGKGIGIWKYTNAANGWTDI